MDNLETKTKRQKIKAIFNRLFEKDGYSYDQFNEDVKTAGKNTLINQKGIKKPEDYLLKGDIKRYGEEKYLDHAPYAFLEIPEDMKTLPVFNSSMPDEERSSPAIMQFRNLNEDIDRKIYETIHSDVKKLTNKFTKFAWLTLGATFLFGLSKLPLPEFRFRSEYSEYLSASDQVYDFTINSLAMAVQFVSAVGVGGGLLAATAIASLAVIMAPARKLLYEFAFYNRMNVAWRQLKTDLTYYHNSPTRQARLNSKEDEFENRGETERYYNAVKYATGALKHDALIKIGRYSGLVSSKGINFAPMHGDLAMIDVSSFRTHALITGLTGSGKTISLAIPIARAFMQACYLARHTCGVLILDGKGVLAHQFRSALPPHLKEKVYIAGTEDGAVGIDIMKDLTPDEFADHYTIAAGSISKSPESGKWISGSANILRDVCEILYLAENSPKKLDLSKLWEDRPYSYYSMTGASAVATDPELRKIIANTILEDTSHLPLAVVEAARNLKVFETLAKETQTSYTSNITDVFSKFTGTLAERFAYGSKNKNTTFISLSELPKGAIIGMSVSAADDAAGGIVLNNIIKSITYSLAQKRDTKSNKAREMLGRVEEYMDGAKRRLIKKQVLLTNMRGNLTDKSVDRYDEVIDFMNSNYPRHPELQEAWTEYKIEELINYLSEKITESELDLARYSSEVEKIAIDTQKLRAAALKENPSANVQKIKSEAYLKLEKAKDATSESSVLVLMDEAHFFLSGGNSTSSDTFFLSIARSTGTVVIAATQSVESIYSKMPESEAASLLTNFGSKFVLNTSDPRTQEMIIRAFGTAKSDAVIAPNGFANYQRVANRYNELELKEPRFGEGASLSTDMNLAMTAGNALELKMRDYDGGFREHLDAARSNSDNESSAVNEKHNREVVLQGWREDQDKSGSVQPILKPEDISSLGFGVCCAVINRANKKTFDLLYLEFDDVESFEVLTNTNSASNENMKAA